VNFLFSSIDNIIQSFLRLPEIKLTNPKNLSVDALERCEKELRIQMQNYVGEVYIQINFI
jgi:hypothetical protein